MMKYPPQPKRTFTLCRESTTPGHTVSRDQILSRYFELANLSPAETKGSIAGQLKALDSICELLGLRLQESNVRQIAAPDIYQAAWLEEDLKTRS